jgi:TetR/AcrR family transcriptional regulator, lmrAB and yxaGH operons repressor
MVQATVALLQRRGVRGVGLLDVVAEAGAPRGSIYHHFPGGKDEVVVAALALAAAGAESAILKAGKDSGSPQQAVRRIAAVFRFLPEKSGWTTGCPVAATAIDGEHQGGAVQHAVNDAFSRWGTAAASVLRDAGLPAKEAEAKGIALIATLEGALLLARGLRSAAPYDTAVEAFVSGLPLKQKSRSG